MQHWSAKRIGDQKRMKPSSDTIRFLISSIMMDISIILLCIKLKDEYIRLLGYYWQQYTAKGKPMITATDLTDISEQIKRLRKQKGWSQQQLAEYAGLDRTTIGALARNGYSDIGIRKVQRILLLLGKTLTLADVGMPTLDDLLT